CKKDGVLVRSTCSSFPVIASTRSLLHKAIKILVFLGCMCGFLYQTFEFLEMYWAYPTILDVRTLKPMEVESPALSFCNANRIRRKPFCTDMPDYCTKYANKTDLCDTFPIYCNELKTEEELGLWVPAGSSDNYTREYVQKLGESFNDFLHICRVYGDVKSNCRNPVNVSWVNMGYPNNCFTVESLWGLPEAQVQKMPLNGKIVLKLQPQPEQYFSWSDLISVHILLHEAHSLENPFTEGLTIETGKDYNVFINQRITERLPAPYNTNCTDYLKQWKENGGYGPMTGKACTEQCIVENMLEMNGCVAQTVNSPGNYPICEDFGIYPSDDINKKCSQQCTDACWEVSYDIIRYKVQSDPSLGCHEKDLNCKVSSYSVLSVGILECGWESPS
ncbi:unnamed protein product, partial [Larinioides sclopetarius]